MASSKGYCAGGIRADGTFIDSAGNIVATAPPCIQLTLRPSLLIYLAIAVIVVGSLTIVLRRARSQADALNYLNRGAIVIGILVIASIIIAQTWFLAIPITEWDGSSAFLYPFPFGAIDVVRTSMVP
ncbi:MAG TPA: hypothetical protein PK781_05360 [Terrimesophilobacter sp.]|nr:hypothetical protein [Terrimesophilobacter sp.]HRP99871.1 hypothetical protein [Terrimesophilobacter sp.]